MWQVQEDDDKVRTLPRKTLKKLLRKGDLSGVELARPKGQTEWQPLYTYAIFSDAVPHQGSPEGKARWRKTRGWLWHLASFIGVMFAMNFPEWGAYWAIGLAVHTLNTMPHIYGLWHLQDSAPAVAVIDHTTETPLAAEPESEPKTSELLHAIDALEALHASSARTVDIDIAALRDTGHRLLTQRIELSQLLESNQAPAEAERSEIAATLDATSDLNLRDALEKQLASLDDRIEMTNDLQQSVHRLVARERAMLHQVEGLRLGLARASVDDEDSPALDVQVQQLRAELAARSEVESTLIRARMANRQRS